MTPGMTTTSRIKAETARARANIYSFFSALILNRPTREMLDGLLSYRGISILETLFPFHPNLPGFRDMVKKFRSGDMLEDDFIVDYDALFVNPGSTNINPIESVYRDNRFSGNNGSGCTLFGPSALEVFRIYRSENLSPQKSFSHHPDHLGIELEFMAFLCNKVARAYDKDEVETAEAFIEKQNCFLKDHIFPWCEKCLEKIEEKATTPLYLCLAALLKSFLEEERT